MKHYHDYLLEDDGALIVIRTDIRTIDGRLHEWITVTALPVVSVETPTVAKNAPVKQVSKAA